MPTLSEALEKFILIKTASLRSEATLSWYRSMLGAFVDYLGNEQDVNSVTDDHLLEYLAALRQQDKRYVDAPQKPVQEGGLSRESLRGHIRALRAFWKWAARRYDMPNPMIDVAMPPPLDTEVKAMEPYVFRALFEATRDTQTGARDRAFLAITADCGGRASEVLQLTVSGLDKLLREHTITGKGSKQRTLYWHDRAAAFLDRWLAERKSDTDAVWVNIHTGQPLTYSGIAQRMEKLAARAGVEDENTNLHAIRHSFALMCAESDMNQALLSSLMGHTSTDTTQRYYQRFQKRQLRQAQRKHSPLRKMLDDHE